MLEKKKITLLPDQVINQIAAGEVVESPASVVKELVENALDAEAKKVHVEIQGGGHQLIRISDDGTGIAPEEAKYALLRHATSKISDFSDLNSLDSLGFRGEALASIASVSKMKVESSIGACGISLDVKAGTVISSLPHARGRGTTMSVSSLFYNVPARRKFQKKAASSSAEISRMLTHLSLAHPTVGFDLISQEKILLECASAENSSFFEALKKRIDEILKTALFSDLLKCDYQKENVSIRGFIGKPHSVSHNRSNQYLFVNKRPIVSPLISYAVQDGYGTRIPNQKYPAYVLHIDLPSNEVDVNVHPQKKQVRFKDEAFVRHIVMDAIIKTIDPHMIAFPKIDFSFPGNWERVSPVSHYENESIMPVKKENYSLKESSSLSMQSMEKKETDHFIKNEFSEFKEADGVKKESDFPKDNGFFRKDVSSLECDDLIKEKELFLVGLYKNYLIVSLESLPNTVWEAIAPLRKEGLAMVDIASARATLAFNQLKNRLPFSKQALLMPITLNLSLEQAELIDAQIECIDEMGISIRRAGKYQFFIDAIPPFLNENEVEEAILSYLEGAKASVEKIKEQLALVLCRFVKAQKKRYMLQEAKEVFESLLRESSFLFDPWGRPIIIPIDSDEIFQRFKKPLFKASQKS